MAKLKRVQDAGNESIRTGLSEECIRLAFLDNLFYVQGRFLEVAAPDDMYKALAYTVRDRLLHRWVSTIRTYQQVNPRTVCYLSAEYLPGPFLGNNLLNLGIEEPTRRALAGLGVDLDELIEHEEEPGLGNGGLGRLAACFMDSLATLQISAISYGIRYEFGIFTQAIRDGKQVETTDNWLRYGNPWEVRRPNVAYEVKLGGHTEQYVDEHDRFRVRWVPGETFLGVAIDTPILGHGVSTVNLLRLWSAEAAEGFDFHAFNRGDYYGAVTREVRSETISKVLYPNDEPEIGKRLRLLQQHFFVTCSLQDMLRIHRSTGLPIEDFHKKFSVQLNDTHPAIAVAELMRLLIDKEGLDWDVAWNVTRHTFAYTNHTLLPEALEKWSIALFENLLPRHLEIIYEINAHFLDDVRLHFPFDSSRVERLSIIDESGPRHVRMAHLACAGSFAINGVAELHSRLLKETVLRDFYEMWPEKFQNKTNGVTPRRFMMLSNPGLASLLTETIGSDWENDLLKLRALEGYADDPAFQERWRQIKRECKLRMAATIAKRCNVQVDPASLYDVQAKRIHEYKRQHLNVLHIITLYNRIKLNPAADIVPRTFIFGGKSAPGYAMAKLMIQLIIAVGEVVNRDPDVAGRLKVVFLPNFSVKLGHGLYPAADLSQQISTAGKEASGTGNMKFSMNGALTIGTLDGANVEIREEVGADNFFLFGLTAEEVERTLADGYRPRDIYNGNPELKGVIDLIGSGLFSHGDRGVFQPLIDNLLQHDPYLLLADYAAYIACQEQVSAAYRDPVGWTRMSILNVARMGKFSSDRTIAEYCRDIWRVTPTPVEL
ncbi:MAG: glycogen/starch/alpha-glucan phosphorylase [Gammaproteobacteria bacterium]|nr:glycogen/starch/alpha-glucan phosphorylase [Rhodocyclaceae bacterium]MBU3908541.1 glycogen/starch/alpha-glucan phosphorylase [Gammaproteobacteria bacterium]MBU3990313.1 glycogen/starch/alpha-glucan phosphorylase [Gammaproteobacteria bacterium]MBU4004569.1 glycogen/starch/alpha-glucan phosphorylase [Gammaproteobacteria bacterium]MBU4021172.1 glycogen/starch/alpha-glucan phosphorylase [Gammaproteobacteria bacterium]